MTLPLVVGVDGSDGSLPALDWAADEAARREIPLRVVHASLWEHYEASAPAFGPDRPEDKGMAEQVVAAARHRVELRAPDVAVDAAVVPDDAVSALLEEAHRAAALVTGASGRGALAGLLLGSVSLSLAGRAHCPVIVVRGGRRTVRGECGRVLVGVGDAEECAAAVRFALYEAGLRHCELEAVRAWRSSHPAGDDSTRRSEERALGALDEALEGPAREHPDVPVRRTAAEGPAHKVLVEASAAADLLVVGAVRHRSRVGFQLGRVSHAVLHHAACPVAVVPHE
ncbi:universal stress protein [Streptomyces sp. ET3-23]|uniref:universal stress protein n=1 Tax=Streptomyces sp. ET3-23 TaxID=2885643 RepID=UPI001D10EFC0|nr:universal stress protein [Streptomyces sp. ET3-23]MCC2274327.1 universal stress protein [Streptomyces sp. ET3-23]